MKNLAPLGTTILMYLYFKDNNKRILFVLIFILFVELILGFVANHKEISFRTPLLFILISFLFNGKVNKVLLVSTIVVLSLYWSYFNAYRLNVIQVRNQTPLEAIANIGKSLSVIKHAVDSDNQIYKSKTTVLGRITTRQYIVILVEGIQGGIETRNGETLLRYFYSFIPRIFWEEKPILTIGNEFNREFNISKSELTFIPTTQLGEFYWNFKLPGVVVGMFFVGVILGLIAKLLDLSVRFNLPRLVLLFATIYMLCARFEATFALQYAKLTRVFILMIVIHFLLKQAGRRKYLVRNNE